jgi:hypothetical protein
MEAFWNPNSFFVHRAQFYNSGETMVHFAYAKMSDASLNQLLPDGIQQTDYIRTPVPDIVYDTYQ